jgi:putative membrane protein
MLYIKALHIVFVVTWFAGLFYIVRLFIYQHEANESGKSDWISQLQLMSKRLWYGITWPSAVLSCIFGPSLLALQYGLDWPMWLSVKLLMVVGLLSYHFVCHRIFKELQQGTYRWNSFKLRIWNEVATLFLIAIVFLVVLKQTMSMLWGILGLVIFAVVLMMAIRIYRRIRTQKKP